jgi:N-acetylmuramoyl-L-alanine amidase
METYRLDTDQIIRHYDVTGKECPRFFVQNPDAWENFLAELAEKS